MNIALLHYSAPPAVGGVESVLGHHARLMTQAGHSVRLIAARGEPWTPDIPLVRIPLADSRHPDIVAAKAELDEGCIPATFDQLKQALTQALQAALSEVDLLIAHNVGSLNKNLPLTAALHQLNGSPGFPHLTLWHHDLAWATPRYRDELYEGYPWRLLRIAWPGVTQVTISAARQRELAQMLHMPPEHIHVIPNGIDVAAFSQLETQTAALVERLDLLSAAPFLLLPVRITPRKNIELALHTLAHLRLSFPAAGLLITGPLGAHNPANVEYFAQLKCLRRELKLETAAHFLAEVTDSYLPDAVIAGFFRLADALFLPSREEGFGIPLLEAAISRLPIFCADIPPLRELGGKEAVYFAPEAAPAHIAAQVTEHLLNDHVFQLARRVRQHYTWEHIYRQQIAPLLSAGG